VSTPGAYAFVLGVAGLGGAFVLVIRLGKLLPFWGR
jgi:hypothetical protein